MQERIRLAEWDNDNDPSMIKKIKEMNSLSWSPPFIKIIAIWRNLSTTSSPSSTTQNLDSPSIDPNIHTISRPLALLSATPPHPNQEYSYHHSRSPIFRDSLPSPFKHTPNMDIPLPWDTLKMTGNHLLRTSGKNKLAQWETALCLPFATFPTIVHIKRLPFQKQMNDQHLDLSRTKTLSFLMQSRTFFRQPERLKFQQTTWPRRTMGRCLTTWTESKVVLTKNTAWFKLCMSSNKKKSTLK